MTEHLTEALPTKFTKAVARTHPGMASWAGWGPVGKTCRQCSHFITNGYSAQRGSRAGLLKPGKCRWFKNYTGKAGASFPSHAEACNKFDENPKPPALAEPKFKF